VSLWLFSFFAGAAGARLGAQSLSYTKGQNVAPAYEGWEQGADGAKYFLFGYMNRNWEEELDVPVGPDNGFSPGSPDQGQPTHFLPRRNRFIFRVKVPTGFTEDIRFNFDSTDIFNGGPARQTVPPNNGTYAAIFSAPDRRRRINSSCWWTRRRWSERR
jgi:hypothetical protein